MKLSKEEILDITPHRDPIQLVDEVDELIPGEYVRAKYYVRPDLDVFRGHFPGDPVLPGVYTVESMAQTASILMLTMEIYKGCLPLFLGISEMSFRRKIKPGGTIILEARFAKHNTEKAVGVFDVTAAVDGIVAAAGKIAIALR